MIKGAAIASQRNSATWPICLACALIDHQIVRNGGVRSSECDACFKEYCYLGTSDTDDVNRSVRSGARGGGRGKGNGQWISILLGCVAFWLFVQ